MERIVRTVLMAGAALSVATLAGCEKVTGVTCGAGTRQVGSACLPEGLDASFLDAPETDAARFCGPGTILAGGVCVSGQDAGTTLTCGPGTALNGSQCVALPADAGSADTGIPVTCGNGTVLSGDRCVIADAGVTITCGTGTRQQGNLCVREETDAGCTAPAAVTSVLPAAATAGVPQKFQVSGTCLPDDITLQITGCSNAQTISLGRSLAVFECTFSSSGTKTGAVESPGADGGMQTLKNVSVLVYGSIAPCVPGLLACAGKCIDPKISMAHCGACGTACDEGSFCHEGACIDSGTPGPSCGAGAADGGTPAIERKCGPGKDQSCCDSILITPEGDLPMGTDLASAPANEKPEHPARPTPYRLDLFEVTVGRFRKFVEAYPASQPGAAAGAHQAVPGSGWYALWTLPATQAGLRTALASNAGNCTTEASRNWTDVPGANEYMAMNCVDWYTSFAFCIWDGGRLPTEAEWEFAAAGGEENRTYPWGETAPSAGLANYGAGFNLTALKLGVGQYPAGRGRFGHYDMVGNVNEWVRDNQLVNYSSAACNDCVLLKTSELWPVYRGSAYSNQANELPITRRSWGYAGSSNVIPERGIRCAR